LQVVRGDGATEKAVLLPHTKKRLAASAGCGFRGGFCGQNGWKDYETANGWLVIFWLVNSYKF
jgi:hypothetical protein